MQRTRFLRIALGLACAAALAVPVVGQAGQSSSKGDGRTFYATDNRGNLLSFSADNPRQLDSMRSIAGLPAGVTLTGIDFRPRTGDLYGIGSDSVVYRVNPQTAIAVTESSTTPPTPFTPALRGRFFGVDFNPMVDRIRVTSDANQNIRLHPDDANVVGADADLNPGDPTVVGSAYTGSSFSAGLASSTVLYALDALDDAIYVQSPPNNGTLTMPQQLDINVRGDSGFDIAGRNNVGYVATASDRRPGAELYRVDVLTGDSVKLGQIGRGGHTLTGLAAVQDLS
jgi:Domain of unknown function (DUF4394)